jgi:signal transduction histidine kinase
MGWDLSGVLSAAGLAWVGGATSVALAAVVWRARGKLARETVERWRERRMREELEAYARVDPAAGGAGTAGAATLEATRALAMRVCRVVAERSAFSKAALMLRDAEGQLYCAGSVGVDDLTVKAMQAWGAAVVEEERGGVRRPGQARGTARNGGTSFAIPLGACAAFDPGISREALEGKKERRKQRRGLVTPVRGQSGKLLGAIIVCADGTKRGWPVGQERAMGPIETLAARIGGSLENEGLNERVLRAEKLAGLGQLAGGVAHALNNPLTAVLGFGELIAESATDPRVRKDASVIVAEALKMKETIQRLNEFWRPSNLGNETVDLVVVLRDLAQACEGKLAKRGVRLILTVEDRLPGVRGSRDKIRQVLEHLLNNAAQAISAGKGEGDTEQVIRVTASHDDKRVNLIVSDTGTGFGEPARVFDPFYTTKAADEGAGLGLSICYGIVREHEGEISAFNLHPRGAAVVIELPAREWEEESGNQLLVEPQQQRRTG